MNQKERIDKLELRIQLLEEKLKKTERPVDRSADSAVKPLPNRRQERLEKSNAALLSDIGKAINQSDPEFSTGDKEGRESE